METTAKHSSSQVTQAVGNNQAISTWKKFMVLHESSIRKFANKIHPSYFFGLEKLGFTKDRYPDLVEINQALIETGWQATRVDGYLSTWKYVEYLSKKLFPIGVKIRSNLDCGFSPNPDFIHDVLGHLPMLFSGEYGYFLETLIAKMHAAGPCPRLEALNNSLAKLGLLEAHRAGATAIRQKRSEILAIKSWPNEQTSLLWRLSKLMLWTMEFGIVLDKKKTVIYGAGILSAPKELALFNPKTHTRPFSLAVLEQDYSFTEAQEQYFLSSSFRTLASTIENIN